MARPGGGDQDRSEAGGDRSDAGSDPRRAAPPIFPKWGGEE